MSQKPMKLELCGLSRPSRSEAMLEVIRQDLMRYRPQRWGLVRSNPKDTSDTKSGVSVDWRSEGGSVKGYKLRVPIYPGHEHITNGMCLLESKRQNMVRTLNMMGSSVSTPRYPPRTDRSDTRLPTRDSRRSLDPRMLCSLRNTKDSLLSPRENLRRMILMTERKGVFRLPSKNTPLDKNIYTEESETSSSSLFQDEEVPKAEVDKKESVSGRFKKLSKLLILLLRGWRLHSKKVHEILDGFGEVHTDSKTEDGPVDLMFDRNYYRMAQEGKVDPNIQQILHKRSKERTTDELQELTNSFRNYRSIMCYPADMQRLIAERAWYESYGPKKVIVREGHPPMRFYFILSGSAVVCVMDEDSRLKTIVNLTRGDSFGELAIINGSNRHSTVISQDQIELLCLTHNDFVDIFMSGGLTNPEDPFLRSLWFMDQWPIEKLIEHPEKSVINYFKRHTVLVPDSNSSHWIYIVKSGSCEILKCLRRANLPKPKLPPKVKDFRQQVLDNLILEDPKYLNHEQLLQLELERRVAKARYDTEQLRERLPQINVATTDAYKYQLERRQPSELMKRKPEREKSHLERLISQKPHMGVSPRVNQGPKAEPSSSKKDDDLTVFKDSILLRETGNRDEESRDLVRRGAIEVKRKQPQYKFPPNSVFVEIGTLTKGDVFGLHELVYQHQPSMCLVSQGAEIILVNKDFYLQHAPDSLIRKLRGETTAYPTDRKLQEALEADMAWKYIRKKSIQQSIEHLEFKKVNINDSRTRYPKLSHTFW